jgi:hypothetical protein
MPIKLKRRKEYRFAAEQELGRTAQARLRAAERQLEEHGEAVQPQVEVRFGRRHVTLWHYRGLAIYFHAATDESLSMDLVVDLRNPPAWYTQPTGDWYETYQREFDASWDEDLVE